jgi:2-keto-4-pentenoate hydratase/2-oxohepta-3-ene-1,7-dioic acid hydratase in catechol pathway
VRLVRFKAAGQTGVGAVPVEDGDVYPTPWASFDELFAEPDPLAAVAALRLDSQAPVHPERLLSPVVYRSQVILTGGNYADHAAEARSVIRVSEPVFLPFLWGAVIGPDDAIVVPTPDTQADYEVQFAVVIGRTARGLTEENAMDHVFGYTIVNDVSAREVTAREQFQVTLSKSVDTFTPVGPHIVTRDEITDPHALGIASYLNGEVRQTSSTAAMTMRIEGLLTMLTRTVTLYPGDILATGTPGGVGYFRTPPEFMVPGDAITVEVEGVGRMMNQVTKGW